MISEFKIQRQDNYIIYFDEVDFISEISLSVNYIFIDSC